MLKRILCLAVIFQLTACAELQNVVNNLPTAPKELTQGQIGNGLKAALEKGITEQVTKLTAENGFYSNELVRILLPEELQKVDQGLRKIGLGNLADKGIQALNTAASDAVKTATPIFVDAVKEITFADAKNILLGEENAATNYLQTKTTTSLYDSFKPVIQNSFGKVGADQIWGNLINKYNSIPFVNKVNPDLTDYVTAEALKGVYTMIAVEEKEIRKNVNSRTSNLLKQVFALQDKK